MVRTCARNNQLRCPRRPYWNIKKRQRGSSRSPARKSSILVGSSHALQALLSDGQVPRQCLDAIPHTGNQVAYNLRTFKMPRRTEMHNIRSKLSLICATCAEMFLPKICGDLEKGINPNSFKTIKRWVLRKRLLDAQKSGNSRVMTELLRLKWKNNIQDFFMITKPIVWLNSVSTIMA